ncbi:MAG TPA: pyrimidine reductase family protein [Acidimicrobiales bacterium]|nr:pyrimidine reductase family protein [Acidimicrobiales bacterium]
MDLCEGEILRALLPDPSPRVDILDYYSRAVALPAERPFVRVNMISSLDGAIAVAGRAGGLGGQPDRMVFQVLRALADVVLVGAGTVRVERYGPPNLPAELQQLRVRRGQQPVPAIAIVTQSCNLDWESKLFTEAVSKPIVIAPGNTSADGLNKAREVADVLTTGAGSANLAAAMAALKREGYGHVLCEGGPTLNTSLAAAGLVDELCLTLSPQLAGSVGGVLLGGWLGSTGVWLSRSLPDGERSFRAQPLSQLVRFSLVHVLEEESYLFLRLRAVQRGGPPAT